MVETNFWKQHAVGGAAARPDSFTGMAEPFAQALQTMISQAPPEVKLAITSGYRSPETQARLWKDALAKYGSPEAARKWVAPPGNSQHNHGNAADLKYLSPNAMAWVHENADKYGLALPLSNEDWHIELATARGGPRPPANVPDTKRPPVMRAARSARPANGWLSAFLDGGVNSAVEAIQRQVDPATRSSERAAVMRRADGAVGGASSRAFDQQYHPGQNMDVYRANAAAAGPGNLDAAGIKAALARGATMVRIPRR